MNRAYSAITAQVFPILALVLAIGASYVGVGTEDTRPARAIMFAIVAAVLAAELTSMVARTHRDQWDGLAITMALVRAAIVHYFGMLALEFGGLAEFPARYWTISRTALGVFGVLALVYMVREDVRAYRELSRAQRVRMLTLLGMIGSFFIVITRIW